MKNKLFSAFVLLSTVLHFSIAASCAQEPNGSTEQTKTVTLLMEQARTEGKIGNTRNLIDILSKVINIDHENGEAYYERGAGHYVLGENNDSIEDYTKAIILKYKVSEALSNRGMVYLVMGNYSKAKEDFDMSIESQPSSEAYSNRASYYIMLKDYGSAIRDGRQAISLNPKDAKACFNVASAYVGLGDMRNGVEFLQQACDLGYQRACDILRQRFGR